jgi:ABC-type lipoprotein export system ATPase subunit
VSESKSPIVEIRNVTKCYHRDHLVVPVLHDISFDIAEGEFLALMGPSGSGKSTLLNCLGGIEKADAGRILFDGVNLCSLREDDLAALRRGSISTVFQFFHLLPTLTATENVELPLQFLKRPPQRRREIARELLEEVGLTPRRDALPRELSGGEMQRVAIARALATEPKLLLADEPTGNLDSTTGERVLDLLERLCLRHHSALVMVTHQPETTRICEMTRHLRDGHWIEEQADATTTS